MNYPAAELRGIKVLELIAITCHSGLDPESSFLSLDSRFRLPASRQAGMTTNIDYTPMQSIEEFFRLKY